MRTGATDLTRGNGYPSPLPPGTGCAWSWIVEVVWLMEVSPGRGCARGPPHTRQEVARRRPQQLTATSALLRIVRHHFNTHTHTHPIVTQGVHVGLTALTRPCSTFSAALHGTERCASGCTPIILGLVCSRGGVPQHHSPRLPLPIFCLLSPSTTWHAIATRCEGL